jgi:hypothetical protein
LSKKVLGEEHPDNLGAMNNCANGLLNQGRWDETEKLQEKVLEGRKVLLGEDHSETLTAMNNLAGTLPSEQRRNEMRFGDGKWWRRS